MRGSDFSSFPFSRVTKMKPLAVKAGSTVTTGYLFLEKNVNFVSVAEEVLSRLSGMR